MSEYATLAVPEFNPDNTNNTERLGAFINDVDRAMADLFRMVPAGLEGTYFEDQATGWSEVSGLKDRILAALPQYDNEEDETYRKFVDAGLTGQAGRAKFRKWHDAARAFLKLRNVRRTSRFLNIGAAIMASIADVAGLGEAWKEAMEGLEYLTDLALSEGSR